MRTPLEAALNLLAGTRLTLLEILPRNSYGSRIYKCRCECGNETTVFAENVRQGRTVSCGCHHLSAVTKHGQYKSATYKCWDALIQRCTNPKNHNFKDYGGRGVTVCERWLLFENFLADMGHRPKGFKIERKDNDGPYSPENCKWATQAEQNRNTRRNRYLVMDGRRQCLRILPGGDKPTA